MTWIRCSLLMFTAVDIIIFLSAPKVLLLQCLMEVYTFGPIARFRFLRMTSGQK